MTDELVLTLTPKALGAEARPPDAVEDGVETDQQAPVATKYYRGDTGMLGGAHIPPR
jgi:hypothetical protein